MSSHIFIKPNINKGEELVERKVAILVHFSCLPLSKYTAIKSIANCLMPIKFGPVGSQQWYCKNIILYLKCFFNKYNINFIINNFDLFSEINLFCEVLKVEGNILILMQQNYFIYQTCVLLIESY